MNWDSRADIQNALLNPFPMKNVLGPAVLNPWDHAEHVLHRERNSRPVMHFYLGHGHNEIRLTLTKILCNPWRMSFPKRTANQSLARRRLSAKGSAAWTALHGYP